MVAAVSCVILLVMAASILARVRAGPLNGAPGKLVTALAWFTTIYAAVTVVLNLATRSSSERAVFAPTAILLFVLVATVMVGSRRAQRGARQAAPGGSCFDWLSWRGAPVAQLIEQWILSA